MKRKLKIAILIDQLILGGVQKIAVEDVRNMQKIGHDVTLLILMRKDITSKHKEFTKGIKVQFLSDSYPWPISKSIKFPVFSFFSTLHILSPFLAPFIIKNRQFDIIISHGTTTCFTAQGLKYFRNIPYFAFIHDPMNYILKTAYSDSILRNIFPFLTPLLKFLEKKLIQHSEIVILDSNLHKKFISNTYKTKSVVLPAGTDIPPKLISNKKTYVIAASRWGVNKNPNLFINLAQDIPRLNIKIAGTWTNQKEFQQFKKNISVAKLENRIKLYPELSEKKLQKLYSEAKFYIHPIKEAFSMGGLEASANGCPIIIPQGSGITDYLNNKEDGIFTKGENYKDFLDAGRELLHNPYTTIKMGLSAHEKVKQLSWTNHSKRLLNLIEKSLSINKITIIALETGHSSESYLSGGDKLLEKMARFLPNNFRIKVIVPSIGTKHWKKANLKRVELLALPRNILDNNPTPIVIFIVYLLRIFQSYINLLRQKKIDILYTSTGVFPDVTPAFLYKITHPGTIWIARIHHLILPPSQRPGPFYINSVSYLLQGVSNTMIKFSSTKTLALNKNLVSSLEKLGFPNNKLEVLGAGIDTKQIAELSKNRPKTYDAVFVGRIHPAKGIYDLLAIWRKVVSSIPNAKVVILGGGKSAEIKKIKKKIENYGLFENVQILGYVPESKLYKTLGSSKIFLFTDYEAGWGLAIGEAMASGLPVIGYNSKIFGDIYKSGFITVPVGDTQMFAKKIITILQDNRIFTQYQKAAFSQAQKLSWEKTSKQFAKIIYSLIS